MAVGLGLVLLMLAALSASSISGIYAYRGMVRDLADVQDAPRKSDLTAAIALLIKPLSTELPPGPRTEQELFAARQSATLADTLKKVRQRITDFNSKLVMMPRSANYREQIDLLQHILTVDIEKKLTDIDGAVPAVAEVDRYAEQVSYILDITGELFDLVEPLPDPSAELLARVDEAQSNYRWHLGVVISAGCAAAAMLLGLVHRANKWVIRPIRDLHQGARRVADGDFDYRLKLRTDDEMAELAGDFNQMTERFQAVRNDLDRQVQERVKQLIRSERLAGVGFLAAGVAHEINNPLSAIAMAAESLEYRVQDWLPAAQSDAADEFRDYLRMMQTEAQRCRQITEKLLDFARGKEGERNLYDVTAIVHEVVAMTRHLGRFQNRTIELNRDAPCYAWVNGPEIKQVVLNLVANALESTDDDGKLTITITEHPDQVELTFRDNGCGMPPEVIEHLFEPFFTTKEVGQGTGLGLSISQRIVRDHDGTLEAESDGAGHGSTFRLRLPTAQPMQQQAA
jgi:signal transduction histidine kinase